MKLIRCDKWKELADEVYDQPDFNLPEYNCVVYVPMDHIARFFSEIEDRTDLSFIVISACSDYGVCYQDENPVALDMKKWLDFVNINEELKYNPLILPSRHDNGNCKITDKYSIKMHSFTKATFNKIPMAVKKWFCTNCQIEEATPIPFGIPAWSEKLILEAREANAHRNSKKNTGFYLNFQNNTAERVAIKDKFGQEKYNTLFKVIKEEISHEDYIKNLLDAIYVVSPSGNGLDCYRNLEALYCGAIPIISNLDLYRAYDGLPILKIANFSLLDRLPDELGFKIFENDLDNSKADADYWFNTLLEAKTTLLQ